MAPDRGHALVFYNFTRIPAFTLRPDSTAHFLIFVAQVKPG